MTLARRAEETRIDLDKTAIAVRNATVAPTAEKVLFLLLHDDGRVVGKRRETRFGGSFDSASAHGQFVFRS